MLIDIAAEVLSEKNFVFKGAVHLSYFLMHPGINECRVSRFLREDQLYPGIRLVSGGRFLVGRKNLDLFLDDYSTF